MSQLSNIGNLMHLYLEEIEPVQGTNAPEFVIKAAAKSLNVSKGHNWVPLIVQETSEDKYKVIGNSFIYAVAEEAGLEKVWCIIADSSDETANLTKILAGEKVPKINLSTATRDEIKAAIEYLLEKSGTTLKGVKLLVATERISEAPRQSWKKLDPIVNLKCGITKGAKLKALEEVFYLAPQSQPVVIEPAPEVVKQESDTLKEPLTPKKLSSEELNKLTVPKLKDMAKEAGISGYSKKPKPELIKLLAV
jgi:ParB-like chromosome segregation protein Spo0J